MRLSIESTMNMNGNRHMQKLYTLALSNVRMRYGMSRIWSNMARMPEPESEYPICSV
jgi:hypothetical protein